MTTILEAAAAVLVTAGQGVIGSTIFAGKLPEGPDALVAIYLTAGAEPVETMGDDPWTMDRGGLQVICRSAYEDIPGVLDKASACRRALASVVEQTISGLLVHRISASGNVIPLGDDKNGRPMASANFDWWAAT